MTDSTVPEAHAPFSECHDVSDERPIRQGDVFEWVSPSSDPLKFLGLVVTADCDIANAKHEGVLSYVPILRFVDYLRLFSFPKLIDRALKSVTAQLTKQIRTLQAANRPEFPEAISEEAALRWLLESDLVSIANELGLGPGAERIRFLELATRYRSARTAQQGEGFDEQFAAIAQLRSKSSAPTQEIHANVWKDISAGVKTLPGDAFFISSVALDRREGYLAYLRLVREIRDDQIAIRYSALRGELVQAKRIARLRSPYIFKLTQQLAAVFGAIALPNEYDDQRQSVIEAMAPGHATEGAIPPDQGE